MPKPKPHRVAPRGHESNRPECLLRFTGAVKRDPAVDNWLHHAPAELQAIAQEWFTHMRNCGRDVRELMHDGGPVACVEDAPFSYVNAFKKHVNVGFYHGHALPDPAGLLEGSGKRMRHVKLKPGCEVNAAALRELIEAAYADIKAHLSSTG